MTSSWEMTPQDYLHLDKGSVGEAYERKQRCERYEKIKTEYDDVDDHWRSAFIHGALTEESLRKKIVHRSRVQEFTKIVPESLSHFERKQCESELSTKSVEEVMNGLR